MSRADRIRSVADARRLARRSVPRALFDYVDGGAEDEVTLGANTRAFAQIAFRPRMGAAVGSPRLDTTVLGTRLALPVLLAPGGLIELLHPDGAAGAARAARGAGTVSVLSTVAGVEPESMAAEPGPRWFQLYAADREVAGQLMARAGTSGFEGLVVTVDTPALGKRERDLRNGVDGALRFDLPTAARLGPQILSRPGWAYRLARSGKAARVTGRPPGAPVTAPSASVLGRPPPVTASANRVVMLASPFSWDDLAWIRAQWTGPLIVKGVLSGDDGRHAVDSGADGVVVSNHGGRQLEGAPATIRVLPEVVEAVGDRVEVLMDGGIRRGGDVVKALALGARAVLIGRPYLWALAAAGEPGVERILGVLADEMSRTLTLLGCPGIGDLDPSWLQPLGVGGPPEL